MSKKKRTPNRAASTCAANHTAAVDAVSTTNATNGAVAMTNGATENVSAHGTSAHDNATAIVPAPEFAPENAAATEPAQTMPTEPNDTTKQTTPTDPIASEETVVAALVATLDAVTELTESRTRQHLSTLRLRGVARELRELVKVMSVYSL